MFRKYQNENNLKNLQNSMKNKHDAKSETHAFEKTY